MPPARTLLRRHLDLLESMGWWQEAEEFVEQYGEEFLNNTELASRLQIIRENRSIHSKAELHGRSFIGENDIVELHKDTIRLSYHLKEHSGEVENIFRHVIRALKALEDNLAYHPKEVNISLHGFRSEIRPDGDFEAGGLYDGRIHLNPCHGDTNTSRGLLITHELVHQAIADIAKGRCPRWLDEGLAIVVSQNLPDRYMEALAELLTDAQPPFPLETLEGAACFRENGTIGQLAHAQAFSMTNHLIETVGWEGVRQLLHQCPIAPLDTALNDFSLNYYLLERQWLRHVKTAH